MSGTAPRPILDHETAAPDGKLELRLWLRMLTCTTLIETEIRRRLRENFGVTPPRFDLMAQIAKAPEGLTMGDLSRRLMVSNGNVTGLTDRLAQEGLVVRTTHPADRRTQIVALTPRGRALFDAMARQHEGWIGEMFGGLGRAEAQQLMRLLARTKRSARAASERTAEETAPPR